MSEWHKEQRRRHQQRLEEMSELEFSQLGIKYVKVTYVVITISIIMFSIPFFVMDVNDVPGMVFAMLLFIAVCLPAVFHAHYDLRRTIRNEEAKLKNG